MTGQIKAILFDFAGVIGTEWAWKWKFQEPENFAEIQEEMYNKTNRGDMTIDEFIQKVASIVGIPPSQVWKDVFPQIVINKELIQFISFLRKKYKVGLFSNYHHDWLEEILQRHDLNKYFDTKFISSRYRLIKPEVGAFEKAIELLGVQKNEVIFVDDRAANIDAARAFGIESIHYATLAQFKKDLMLYQLKSRLVYYESKLAFKMKRYRGVIHESAASEMKHQEVMVLRAIITDLKKEIANL